MKPTEPRPATANAGITQIPESALRPMWRAAQEVSVGSAFTGVASEYCWYMKKQLGEGKLERFFFHNLSFTRLNCQFSRQLDLPNEYSSEQFGFHIVMRGHSDYAFYNLQKSVTMASPQVWVQNGALGKFKMSCPSGQRLEKIAVFLHKDYLAELYQHHPDNALLQCLTQADDVVFQPLAHISGQVFALASELLNTPCQANKLAQIHLQGLCLSLVSQLLEASPLWLGCETDGNSSIAAQAAAVKVKAYLDEHPASNKTIGELARLSGTNSCYLKYEFKKLTAMTLHQYRQQVRMRQALAMLKDPSTSIPIIAQQLGFNSSDYFIKVFRGYFGHHPKVFRGKWLG